AHSVMTAYNAINGVPASVNTMLLQDMLREEWGFDGYVVSDCGAVADVVFNHKYITDPEKAVAEVVKAGLDLECECCGQEESLFDNYLEDAVEKGYITEEEIDGAVGRLMRARFLLGMFDPPERVPYSKIPEDIIESETHQQLALETARKSIILLENKDNFLPINREEIKSVAVIGPNANVCRFGNYTGVPANPITPLDGIKNLLGPTVEVMYAQGCDLEKDEVYIDDLDIADKADLVILAMGTSLKIETEENDRTSLDLPESQVKLIQEVYKKNKNVVLVLINGSPLATNWSTENLPAILEAWYPGQSGGQAIAEVIFGEYNPAGRLPMTAYKSTEQLQDFSEYDITKGQTYMYLEEAPLYPFGYGLSYTSFEYDQLKVTSTNISLKDQIKVSVSLEVANSGEIGGDEVVQLYVIDKSSSVVQPLKELRGFKRVSLDEEARQTISFDLTNEDFSFWDESTNAWKIEPGAFEIQVGASSTDIRLSETLEIGL
ncbi:MAG: glycoside hydrolase family 3 C-terminal domain-containing protein, partial [Bacteroidota bacterium]